MLLMKKSELGKSTLVVKECLHSSGVTSSAKSKNNLEEHLEHFYFYSDSASSK